MKTKLGLLWSLLKPPRGHGVRRSLALWNAGVGLVYLLWIPRPLVTASCIQQNDIMPLWIYGAVMLGCSLAMLGTMGRRHALVGRLVALVAFVIYILFAATFSTPSAVWTYSVFAYMAFGELSFLYEEEV